MKLIEHEQELRNKMRYKHIGDNIRDLRKEKGWTQIELAQKAGVHHSVVSRIEYSLPPQSCSLSVFFRIADALEVEPVSLIPGNFETLYESELTEDLSEEDWVSLEDWDLSDL